MRLWIILLFLAQGVYAQFGPPIQRNKFSTNTTGIITNQVIKEPLRLYPDAIGGGGFDSFLYFHDLTGGDTPVYQIRTRNLTGSLEIRDANDKIALIVNQTNVYFGGTTTPTAKVQVAGGSATVPALKLDSGALLITPQAGALEYATNTLYFTTTGTNRVVLLSTNGVVNVQSFGAVGDGVTDCSTAVQAAVDSLPASTNYTGSVGGTVYFPGGTYCISNTITLKRSTTLSGDRGAAVIKWTGLDADLFSFAADTYPADLIKAAKIQNLVLITDITNSLGSAIRIYGITNYCEPSLSEVHVIGPFHEGITLKNCIMGRIKGCRVQSVEGDAFVLANSANGVVMSDCYANANKGYGYKLYGNYCALTACAADLNVSGGYYCELASTTINSCGAEQNSGNSFTLTNCSVVSLNNCYIVGGAAGSTNGIWIDGGDTISINSLHNDGNAGGASGYGIVITNVSGSYPSAVNYTGGFPSTWGLGAINDSMRLTFFQRDLSLSLPLSKLFIATNAGTDNLVVNGNATVITNLNVSGGVGIAGAPGAYKLKVTGDAYISSYLYALTDVQTPLIYPVSSGTDMTIKARVGSGKNVVLNPAEGNVVIGGTTMGASARASIGLYNGTAPSSSAANMVQLYGADVSASSELLVRNEAGLITQLSGGNLYNWSNLNTNDLNLPYTVVATNLAANIIPLIGAGQTNLEASPISVVGTNVVVNTNLLVNGSATGLVFAVNTNQLVLTNGNVGIGTTAPLRRLDINDASGNTLRLIYNDSDGSPANYSDFLVSTGGNLTVTPSGGLTTASTRLVTPLLGVNNAAITNNLHIGTNGTPGTVYIRDGELYLYSGALLVGLLSFDAGNDGYLNLWNQNGVLAVDLRTDAVSTFANGLKVSAITATNGITFGDATVQTTAAGGNVSYKPTGTNYTLTASDYIVGCRTNGLTLNLPVAATAGAGKIYVIKDESGAAGTSAITVDANGTETIDGALTKSLVYNYQSINLYSNGTNWFIH